MTNLDHLLADRARRLILVPILILFAVTLWKGEGALSAHSAQSVKESNCVSCHSRADGLAREVVSLHGKSSHRQLGCDGCHGGDPSEYDEAKAHSGTFVGKPDTTATLTMCARCHEAPLTQFKQGRHFRPDRATTKMDCVMCHGAHTVGAPPETFSFVQFCAGCHGLEYLPQLPVNLRDLLAVSDDLRKTFREAKGPHIPDELSEDRRAIRRSVSQIVHPTDLKGAEERIPGIIERGRLLKERIGRLNSKGER